MLLNKWYYIFSERLFLTGLIVLIKTLATIRKKSRSLMVFAGILKYRMSPDVYSYLARLDVEIAL